MKNKIWLLSALIILGVIVAVVLSMEDTANVTEKTEGEYLPKVSYIQAKARKNSGQVRTLAEVQPRWSAELKAQVSGELISVETNALAGQKVKKGDLLIQIEGSSYKARLKEAEQRLAQSKLELLQEQNKNSQAKRDWKRSGISKKPSALALNEPQLEIAQKAVEAAESEVEAQKKNVSYTRVIAPFDGFVTDRYVSLGQTIDVGERLLHIINDTALDITVSLNQKQWKLLDKKWKDKMANILDEGNSSIGLAKIKRGGGFLDPQTRLYKIFLEVNAEHSQALSGEFVHVELPGKSVSDSFTLPESALTREGTIWYIDLDDRLRHFQAELLYHMPGEIVIRAPRINGKAVLSMRIALNPLVSFLNGNRVDPVQGEE
ncbi:MAG: efflux RND transporter periplasmic adaptor subunit [Alphaproteobacteria bacterium]